MVKTATVLRSCGLALATASLMTTAAPAQTAATPTAQAAPPAATPDCTDATADPYKNYACLDKALGDDALTRFARYYPLEMGQAGPPADPTAPSSHRDGWPSTPQTTPPMPFTEWPYGGTTSLGVSQPNAVDSPLMTAIANTPAGNWMSDNHLQLYGWINGGFNISSNSVHPGGNAPVAYAYTPNTAQLDQAVLYLERVPDTVQTDHVDWGFRLSAIYGVDYRYTQSYSPITTDQYLKKNNVYGYDFPMIYGELYIPQVAEGLMIRVGRYISVPDIEAQLAPNNYMYTHSLTYAVDNYTNEGIQTTLALTKNLMVQLGVNIGTEAWIGNVGKRVNNPYPNPLYPGNTFLKDPGAQPSFTACIRYTWNDGKDAIYPCMDAINNGVWGYNNLQWYGTTYYHKFNDQWHVSFEVYDLHEDGVPNLNNPTVMTAYANGGTPFSPQYTPFNAPGLANCHNAQALKCTASAIGVVAYINYQISPLDNVSIRPEFYDDKQGQRTGTKATYYEISLGWQHWLSPQIELRPEVGYYRSMDAKAFNGNANAGIAPNKNYTMILAADAIVHF